MSSKGGPAVEWFVTTQSSQDPGLASAESRGRPSCESVGQSGVAVSAHPCSECLSISLQCVNVHMWKIRGARSNSCWRR